MRRSLNDDTVTPCRLDVVVTLVDVLLGALDEGAQDLSGHVKCVCGI